MSVVITEVDFRKAFFGASASQDSFFCALPVVFDDTRTTYDGTWIKLEGAAGLFYYIGTGFGYERAPSTDKSNPNLLVYARLKTDTDNKNYMFFLEPHKGGYSEYQGIDNRDGATHYARSRNNSSETITNINPQDWTSEHEFAMKHEADDSDIYFYIDGGEVANHTNDVSSQPYEICCCEANGVANDNYLKYPPGIRYGD